MDLRQISVECGPKRRLIGPKGPLDRLVGQLTALRAAFLSGAANEMALLLACKR